MFNNIFENTLCPSVEAKLIQALLNQKVTQFVVDAFVESYQRHFFPHRDEVVLMIETAISLLKIELTEKKKTHQSLFAILTYINENIFKTNNKSFWFNKIYSQYKKNIRPKIEYAQIKTYIHGKKILDFGSGSGFLALELKKRRFTINTTDVLDYRIKEAEHIAFKKMHSPEILDYASNSIDTITVKAVLHHINEEYLTTVLGELKRVAKRLVIEESVFFDSPNKQAADIARQQPVFKQFLSFNPENQYLALLLIDFFTNALAFGKPNMNLPFAFRSIEEWKQLLETQGFAIKKIEILGMELARVTPDSRALIIVERR